MPQVDNTIQASKNAILVFSYIGYRSEEIEIKNRSNIDVILAEDAAALNEVVVVGYGTQRKKDITGAIVSITPAQLKEMPTSNIVNSLKGRLAGVDKVSLIIKLRMA